MVSGYYDSQAKKQVCVCTLCFGINIDLSHEGWSLKIITYCWIHSLSQYNSFITLITILFPYFFKLCVKKKAERFLEHKWLLFYVIKTSSCTPFFFFFQTWTWCEWSNKYYIYICIFYPRVIKPLVTLFR